jgi:hypothetical protein
LLRSRIARRQRDRSRFRRSVVALEKFRCAEIEHLDVPIGRDEHVRRLEIAMNHQQSVRRIDGAAELGEQAQTSISSQRVRPSELEQLQPLDIFHADVRDAVVADSGIEHTSDAGMRQLRKDPLLASEPPPGVRRKPMRIEQFQRDDLFGVADAPNRAKDVRRAAATHQFGKHVGPDGASRPRSGIERRVAEAIDGIACRRVDERVPHPVGAEHCGERGALRFAQPGLVEPPPPGTGWYFHRLLEQAPKPGSRNERAHGARTTTLARAQATCASR